MKNQAAAPQAAGGQAQAPVPMVLPDPPMLEDQAWALIDYFSGHVICEHNSQAKIWPASLTKMMTSYVIGMEVKAGRLNLDSDIVIPEDAWSKNYSDSSKMFIEVGKEIKVRDLVKGIIIQSGNDACVAMALHLAGTEQGFVGVMNSYAQKLGLKNTHFSNVHGLYDEQNYSTAYDMALMGRALIRDLPEEYVLYSQKEFTFNGIKQYNRNRLLWDNSVHVDGIKTGHLSQVGYNLVASATEDNMRLIASVIGAKSDKQRAADCKALLTYGFRYFELYSPFSADKVLLSREVRMGSESKVDLGLAAPLQLMIPRTSQNRIKIGYRLKSPYFVAPIEQGEELGFLEVKLDERVLASAPLVAKNAVAEGNFFSKTWDRIMLFFSSPDDTEAEGSTPEAQSAESAEQKAPK
ncbi:MAG: D-alanyl-D-alanine carboxypeptidase [Succinivibrio sp.]|nr:D-alanyl-D-alanine carboxypeptidase [Succinivibrio sp.]